MEGIYRPVWSPCTEIGEEVWLFCYAKARLKIHATYGLPQPTVNPYVPNYQRVYLFVPKVMIRDYRLIGDDGERDLQ